MMVGRSPSPPSDGSDSGQTLLLTLDAFGEGRSGSVVSSRNRQEGSRYLPSFANGTTVMNRIELLMAHNEIPAALHGHDIAVVDVEGNGQNPPEVIEIAIIPVAGTVVSPGDTRSWLVKPKNPITPIVTHKVHGITNDDVAGRGGCRRTGERHQSLHPGSGREPPRTTRPNVAARATERRARCTR